MCKKREIIVFDICNTLFHSNTTFEFIEFYHQHSKGSVAKRWLFIVLLSKKSLAFWALLLLGKIVRKDLLKQLAVYSFKNEATEKVEKLAHTFYETILCQRKISKVFDLFHTFKRDHIVLASSTIRPVAEAIAAGLNVRCLSTELGIHNEAYDGKISNEINGRKFNQLRQSLGEESEIVCAVSDNYSDLTLLAAAAKGYAVCHSEKNILFWKRQRSIMLLDARPQILRKRPHQEQNSSGHFNKIKSEQTNEELSATIPGGILFQNPT